MVSGNWKGGQFERDTSRWLTKWLTRWLEDDPREKPTELWRSTSSGGVEWEATVDIAPNGRLGMDFCERFGVECKARDQLVLWNIYTRGKSRLYNWWVKTWEECLEYEITPLLFLLESSRPRLMAHPSQMIPATEVRFERSLVWEAAELRLIPPEEWYDLPVEQVYEFCDRYKSSAAYGPPDWEPEDG